MGKATKLIAEMQILLFSAADGKLQAQHSSCHWKKLFSYVVCAVWLKKKDHTVYGYCERLDGNTVNWSLTQNRDG